MKVFNELIQADNHGNILFNQWVEWEHFLIPNKPQWFREILRGLMLILGHCMVCTVLDGCYFVDSNMPKQPLHEKCDCDTKPITYINVKNNSKAECDILKFTNYVFEDDIKSKGKNKIFHDLGFTIDDSTYLKQEFCNQALRQYQSGNYILKNLDICGQRLAIPITLNGTTFYSGWMLYPEGLIKNTTPFGGWIK